MDLVAWIQRCHEQCSEEKLKVFTFLEQKRFILNFWMIILWFELVEVTKHLMNLCSNMERKNWTKCNERKWEKLCWQIKLQFIGQTGQDVPSDTNHVCKQIHHLLEVSVLLIMSARVLVQGLMTETNPLIKSEEEHLRVIFRARWKQ